MQLSFGLEHPLTAVLLFSALSVWALRAYARTVPPLARGRRLFLSGLRLAASLLLALMLGGFHATLMQVDEEAARLRILVDASASMSRPARQAGGFSDSEFVASDEEAQVPPAGSTDLTGVASRYALALETEASLRERFEDRLDLTVQAFGLSLRDGPLPEAAAEAGTDLGAALAALPVPRPGESVLLLSDGRDTEGALWAEQLSPGRPIHSILFGDTLQAADLRIDRVDVPPVVHKGARVPLSVEISSRGAAPRSGRLQLREDGILHAEESWSLEPGVDHQRVEMTLVLEETGQRLIELFVSGEETDSGESTNSDAEDGGGIPGGGNDVAPENNRRVIPLRVVEGQLRILVLAGRPDWDLSALVRGLQGEEALELKLVTAGPEGGLREAASGRPWEPGDQEFHGLVLHSLHRDWPVDLLDRLRLRGGAFLMGGYIATARPSELARNWSLTAPSKVPQRKEVLLDWGAGARRHSAVQGIVSSSPPLSELSPLEETRPNPLSGGRVLLRDDRRPVLSARELGGRRLVVSSARGFWRWPLGSQEGGLLLERLYSGLLRWLAQEDPPDRLAISWDEEGILAGQASSLRAELFDADFNKLPGALLSWSVRGGDSLLIRGSFVEDARQEQYRMELPALPEGVFRLEVNAQTPGGEELRRELNLPVLPPEREMLDPAASAETLRWLAARSGGIFLASVDLDALEDALDFTPQRRTLTRAVRLWQHPLLFLLLLALLAAEWGLRKRFGMV